MNSNSNLLKLHDRGLFAGVFPEEKTRDLYNALISSPQTLYCGFDPTAESLHVGNLLALISLLHCQRGGHQAIVVIGGATAKIGDPSGRSTERSMIEQQTILQNIDGITKNIETIFHNHSQYFCTDQSKTLPVKILNNDSWYSEFNVIDFLCKVGRQFRMGTMLGRQSVQSRLRSAEGLSLTEFMYQVFQAYDWLHLNTHFGCTIQIGGNDQLGNIVSGYELIGRISKKPLFGLTIPLITNTAGDKLGKTAGNAVWLSSEKTSSFDFYQFFIRQPDSEVEKYLKLFTFLSGEEIEQIVLKHKSNPENRTAQKKLAEEVTLLVHGEAGLKSAQQCTDVLYKGGVDQLAKLSQSELRSIFKDAPSVELFLEPGTTILDATMKANCFRKEGDADRVIKAGGVHINGLKVTEPQFVLIPGEHILPNGLTLIRIGKKNYYMIKWLGIESWMELRK